MTASGSGNHRSPRLSRRQTLRLLGGAGAAALLAACGGEAATTPATAPGGAGMTTTTAAAPTATTAAARATTATDATAARTATGSPTAAAAPDGQIRIVNSGAKLPTEKVTFRWIDSGDQKAVFWKAYFPEYQKAHPNITVAYDPLPWNEIQKVVPLGIQNGNAHDVFQVPLNVPGAQAVSEGWVAPLDDLIPNFAEWKKAFPPGAFVPGITDFNGKSYTLPLTSNKRYGTLLLYNVDYMRQAGYDPAAKPLTWDEFRAAAKKITEQGKGQYFGWIVGGNQVGRWSEIVANLARMAGAVGSGGNDVDANINWKTGEYNYLTDQYLAAIDLLLALKADGSVFPGSLSINAPQARAQMPNGVAGMILQGPWNIPQWQRENPNFNFGVASQPVPNSGTPMPLGHSGGGSNQLWIYAKSPHKQIAADIFHYAGSLEGQTAWGTIIDGADSPIFPEANKLAKLSPRAKQAEALFAEQMRLHPDPRVRNLDASQVYLEIKPVKPNFGEVVQGIFTGQLRDPKAAMQDLRDRSEQELERAIKAAVDKGAKVSRDDWKFANWDPTKDYTDAEYKALQG